MKSFAAIATGLALAMSVGAAHAQDEIPTAKVSYADLDLSRSGGRDVLERRIGRAIETVCPRRPLPTELAKARSWRTCRELAWTGAQRQLYALYGGARLAESAVQVSGAGAR